MICSKVAKGPLNDLTIVFILTLRNRDNRCSFSFYASARKSEKARNTTTYRAEGRKEYYDASGKKPGVNRPRLCIDSWNKSGMYLLSPSRHKHIFAITRLFVLSPPFGRRGRGWA